MPILTCSPPNSPILSRSPGRMLASCVLAFTLPLLLQRPAHAQQGAVTGRVIDAEGAAPMPGVTVKLVTGSGRLIQSTTTDDDGEFRLQNILQGSYSLLLSALGFETHRLDGISVQDATVTLGGVELVSRAFRLNPIVVSVSRDEERAFDAPAAVYAVETEQIEERTATTAIEYVRDVPAVDVIQSGLGRNSVALRGFNSTWDRLLLALTDYRRTSMPALGFNAYNMISATDEDIERVEVVLGPGSAVYGPNTANGVLHLLTRSPLDHQENTVSVTGGERGLFQTTLRHAGLINENVGYKVSGFYFRGDEWEYVDPVEQANREAAIAQGADPDTLLIGRRDFNTGRFSADARLDFRVSDRSDFIFSGGLNRIVSSIEQSNTIVAQMKGWSYNYLQGRFRSNELFAQMYVNWSNAGDTYTLRAGEPLVDRSSMYVGQVRHATDLGQRQRFTYGADLIRTIPRTDGTINGRYEEDDDITEIGGYLQSETKLTPTLDLVAALRLDYHSRMVDELVWTPRVGLVFEPVTGQNLRLTYNRAFFQPGSSGINVDIVASPTLSGLPFAVLVEASRNGWTFQRDCSSPLVEPGLCMRSPFTPEGMGGPSQYLPLDATLFWDAAVQILSVADPEAGAILGMMDRPDASQVETMMLQLNPSTGALEEVGDAFDVPPLKPQITTTFEAGYKGLIGDRLLLGVNAYYTQVQDFVSGALDVTPSVFMEPASLGAYIASEAARLGLELTPEDIAALTQGVASIPLATVTPTEPPRPGSPADIILSARNLGDIDFWGGELSATLLATNELSFTGTYSYVSENFWARVSNFADISLNAPQNKALLAAAYRSARLGLAAELRVRYVGGYQVNSGVFIGPIETYTLIDAFVTYTLPFSRGTQVSLTAVNMFDDRHQEIPGAPFIGRMVLLRLRQSF
jgi:outer membrane receptor for ferrienterochelin and colicins